MRATIMYAAGDVRVENVPDATIAEPTDAIEKVTDDEYLAGPPVNEQATANRSDHAR
jgi:hypothetical protein